MRKLKIIFRSIINKWVVIRGKQIAYGSSANTAPVRPNGVASFTDFSVSSSLESGYG